MCGRTVRSFLNRSGRLPIDEPRTLLRNSCAPQLDDVLAAGVELFGKAHKTTAAVFLSKNIRVHMALNPSHSLRKLGRRLPQARASELRSILWFLPLSGILVQSRFHFPSGVCVVGL